jgi:epoxide hydrolase 4
MDIDLSGKTQRFVANGPVRLHYVAAGEGPPLVFLHGIPGFWNCWSHQLAAFAGRFRVAAMDLRGFNLSDKPKDVRAYRLAELIGDVVALLRKLGAPVSLVGHDWGALIAWWVATLHPDLVARLAVLAAPHPACYLAARQAGDLTYSQLFRDQILAALPGAPFDPAQLSAVVSDPAAREELALALQRSDPEAIRNYYRANLPSARIEGVVSVRAPTLILYGDEDRFIPAQYYALSAEHVTHSCDIRQVPRAGHFLHTESAEQVTSELESWFCRRP